MKLHLPATLLIVVASAIQAFGAQPESESNEQYVHVPTITDLFARAPRTVFPLLDRNTRLDMIDYYNSGLPTPSRNLLGGQARITSADSTSLEIAMSDVSTYRMTLLPSRSDTVIALVRTVELPTPDSDVKLYTTSWVPIESGITLPSTAEWLKNGIKGTDRDVLDLLPFVTATITIEGNTLSLKPSLTGRYTPADSSRVADAMYQNLHYRWDESRHRFKR